MSVISVPRAPAQCPRTAGIMPGNNTVHRAITPWNGVGTSNACLCMSMRHCGLLRQQCCKAAINSVRNELFFKRNCKRNRFFGIFFPLIIPPMKNNEHFVTAANILRVGATVHYPELWAAAAKYKKMPPQNRNIWTNQTKTSHNWWRHEGHVTS